MGLSRFLRQQDRIARQGALIELQRNRIEWSDDTCRRVMLRLEEVYTGKTPMFHDLAQSRRKKARKGRTTT